MLCICVSNIWLKIAKLTTSVRAAWAKSRGQLTQWIQKFIQGIKCQVVENVLPSYFFVLFFAIKCFSWGKILTLQTIHTIQFFEKFSNSGSAEKMLKKHSQLQLKDTIAEN